MARYHPRWNTAPILDAAAQWRNQCLIADGSLFGGESANVWTLANAAVLGRDFVEQPDLGEGTFLGKLQSQLADSGPGGQQLAAEMLWALLLFQSNVTPAKKRDIIATVWSWSGTPMPTTPLLDDAVLRGIGSGGQSFNTYRWKELALLINRTIALKQTRVDERRVLLEDPWKFSEWVEARPDEGYRQLPNMLRYLLFPEQIERITTIDHKLLILQALAPNLLPQQGVKRDIDLDRALLELRQQLTIKRGSEAFDYYEPEFEARWRHVSAWLLSWNPSQWVWEHFEEDRSAAARGEVVKTQWTCASTKPEPGHKVYLYKAGKSPRGMIARGQVLSPSFEADHYDPDKAKDGKRARYIQIALEDIRDVDRDAFITGETLTDAYAAQKWSPYASGIEIRPKALEVLEELWSRLPPVVPDTPGELPLTVIDSPPYSVDEAMDGLFLDRDAFERMLALWRTKKNLILQGAPGTGKSFVARRLAWALIGARDDRRIESVQFHQSYGYEDFVQGYRPTGEGGFELRDGAFYAFCRRAAADPEREHVFIIDEINRGNLSKIFGELMLLIEHDKRRSEWGARLAYATEGQPRFHVPDNVHIIGMMNTADRSLSLVDYALRRRFAFVTLAPQFTRPGFKQWLSACGVSEADSTRLIERMTELNAAIASDTTNLGPGFRIGHSFFAPAKGHAVSPQWYERVVESEIRPLLEEYWFDRPDKADHWCTQLLAT